MLEKKKDPSPPRSFDYYLNLPPELQNEIMSYMKRRDISNLFSLSKNVSTRMEENIDRKTEAQEYYYIRELENKINSNIKNGKNKEAEHLFIQYLTKNFKSVLQDKNKKKKLRSIARLLKKKDIKKIFRNNNIKKPSTILELMNQIIQLSEYGAPEYEIEELLKQLSEFIFDLTSVYQIDNKFLTAGLDDLEDLPKNYKTLDFKAKSVYLKSRFQKLYNILSSFESDYARLIHSAIDYYLTFVPIEDLMVTREVPDIFGL
jgi:hypothetical protein